MRLVTRLAFPLIVVLFVVLLVDRTSDQGQASSDGSEARVQGLEDQNTATRIETGRVRTSLQSEDSISETSPSVDYALVVNAVDGFGVPISDVVVVTTSMWGDDRQMSGITDKAGQALFAFQTPVIVTVVGTRGGVLSVAGPVAVNSHMPQQVDIVFADCVGLRVRVVNEAGGPVDAAHVSIGNKPRILSRNSVDEMAGQQAMTDEDGLAEFLRVPDSVAYISVHKKGHFAPVATIRTPTDGGEHTIVMVQGETVRVLVVDDLSDEPVSRVALHVNLNDSAVPSPEHNIGVLITDEYGVVEFSRPSGCSASCYVRGEVGYHGYGMINPTDTEYTLRLTGGGAVRCVLVLHGLSMPRECVVEYNDGYSTDYVREIAKVAEGAVTVHHQGTRTSPRFRIRADGGSSSWRSFRGRLPPGSVDVDVYRDAALIGLVVERGTDLLLDDCIVSAIDILDTSLSFLSPPYAKCVARTVTDVDGVFRLSIPSGRVYEIRVDGGVHGHTSTQIRIDRTERDVDVGRVLVDNSASLTLALFRNGRPVSSCFGWIACHDIGKVQSSALTEPMPSFRKMFRTDGAGVAQLGFIPTGKHVLLVAGPSAVPPHSIPNSFGRRRYEIDVRPGDNGVHRVDL